MCPKSPNMIGCQGKMKPKLSKDIQTSSYQKQYITITRLCHHVNVFVLVKFSQKNSVLPYLS